MTWSLASNYGIFNVTVMQTALSNTLAHAWAIVVP